MTAPQFSEYDERPDPRTPGKQGVLFRRLAPAMTHEIRYQRRLREGTRPLRLAPIEK